jgi:hypothetical protein
MNRIFASLVVLLIVGASVMKAQVIYNSASTAAEGAANGLSNVISAQGQKNVSDSQAAINLTQARSAQIDNQVKSVNAFWEKNAIYSEHQQQQFADIQKQREFYLSRHALQSLTPEEFDRASGTINWPRVLEQKQYDQYRTVLDKLLKDRAYNGALTSDQYLEATTANKDWRAMLAKQKGSYPEQVLSQMLRFILKVNREVNDNLG